MTEKLIPYINRLTKEWKEHSNIIIGVDYDSTISPWATIDNKDDIERTINLVKACKDVGAYIVLHSCCDESRHHDMLEYCEKIDLKIDAINETPIKLPYDKSNKPYCNIYLDDRAGLNEALIILEEAMYNQRIHNNQIKFNNLNDIA